jgi:hypothetical protein
VALPSPLDLHPDHSALGVATCLALAASPATPSPLLLAYVIHNPRLRRTGAAVHRLELSESELGRKREAVRAHRSQLVWRGRWLEGFAGTQERFFEASPRPGSPSHPIRAARVAGAEVALELASHPRPRAAGRQRLWLVGQRQGRSLRLTAELPLLGRERPIVDTSDGTVAGACRLAGPPFRRRVALRAAALEGAAPLWVHVQRRVGFFDEGGWVLIAEQPAAAARG